MKSVIFHGKTGIRALCALLFLCVVFSLSGCEIRFPEKMITRNVKGNMKKIDLPLSCDADTGLSVCIDLVLAETDHVPFRVYPLTDGLSAHAVISYPDGFSDFGFSAGQEPDGVFLVTAGRDYRYRAEGFSIDIYAPVSVFEISGELEIEADCGGLACPEELTLLLSGAVDVRLSDVSADTVTVTASGAADIEAEGICSVFSASIEGAGEIDASELITGDSSVSIKGAGNAAVNASDTLTVSITGAGTVSYLGEPTVTKNITGAGSVFQEKDD